MAWFADKKYLLNWPARFPDLNPIENLWGILAHEIYKTVYRRKKIRRCAVCRNFTADQIKNFVCTFLRDPVKLETSSHGSLK
jgi:hypothetical protein